MKQFLAVSVLGPERRGLLRDITRAALDCGCLVADSHMNLLGEEFALQMLVDGKWDAIARLETTLNRLADNLGVTVTIHRSHERAGTHERIPYSVDAIAADSAGIMHHLVDFFTNREIEISELNTRGYPAPRTGAPLFAIQMVVAVPVSMAIATLREEFMELCDRINLDAIIEPMKN
jgi:glycine cleavage system transcriptional repressor